MLDHEYMMNFVEEGYCSLGEIIDSQKCRQLLTDIQQTRNFGQDLFLNEKEFRENPQYTGVNPCPGRNLLEKIDLNFIECNEILNNFLSSILGDSYSIVIKKLICGVPQAWIPEWVRTEIDRVPVANLGAFIKPYYRDITYFYGIDFHQDIIDYKNRKADFITLYVYLDKVSESDSPLFILPRSHLLGATSFPHNLVPSKDTSKNWVYSDSCGNSELVNQLILTGDAGSVWLWHSCLLHGTQPNCASQARISIRYIIERSSNNSSTTLLDKINTIINGPLCLNNTRVDLDDTGKAILKGNIVKENAKA